MNRQIELHDSTLESIVRMGPDLLLRLRPAYVHRSEGRPGIDPGSGWLQDIDLILREGVAEALPSEFPFDLESGSFEAGEDRWENSIPLPLSTSATARLAAVTTRGARLEVRGAGASAVRRGEPRYVEEFRGTA